MKSAKVFILIFAVLSLMLSSCEGANEASDDNVDSIDMEQSVVESVELESSEEREISNDNSFLSAEASEIETFLGGVFDDREELKFVALGDSIARGYGLSNPKDSSYPAIVCEAVRQNLDGTDISFTNYGIDGLKTSQMLKLLENGYDKLDGADIVTVCIGANNVLLPFMIKIAQILPMTGTDINGIDSPDVSETMADIFDKINNEIRSEAFAAEMNAGIEQAKQDLPLIYAKIKERAPDAKVLVMTLYSPYHGVELSLPYLEQSVVFTDLSDHYVSSLNDVIKACVNDAGFVLVDCYQAFQETDNMLNLGVSIIPPRFSIDPHPNLTGHICIANLHIEEMSKRY